MTPADPAPADPQPRIAPPIKEDQARQSMRRPGGLADTITPWLLDIGEWVFGGLLAFGLLIIASILTVGPVDAAIKVSMVALACALPLNVAGLLLLRLVKDIKDVALEEAALKALRAADPDFPEIDAYSQPRDERRSLHKRLPGAALRFSLGTMAASLALTLAGLVAALWYMGWWIGVALLAMVGVSLAVVIFTFSRALPPETEAERDLNRRYAEWKTLKETRRAGGRGQ